MAGLLPTRSVEVERDVQQLDGLVRRELPDHRYASDEDPSGDQQTIIRAAWDRLGEVVESDRERIDDREELDRQEVVDGWLAVRAAVCAERRSSSSKTACDTRTVRRRPSTVSSVGVLRFARSDETLRIGTDGSEKPGWDLAQVGDDALVEDGLLLGTAELLELGCVPELARHRAYGTGYGSDRTRV